MKRLLAVLVVLFATQSTLACPMCKDSISNSEGQTNELHDSYTANGQNISGGMNVSVYVMLGTFFGVLGMISTVIVKGVRSSSASQGFPIERKQDK